MSQSNSKLVGSQDTQDQTGVFMTMEENSLVMNFKSYYEESEFNQYLQQSRTLK